MFSVVCMTQLPHTSAPARLPPWQERRAHMPLSVECHTLSPAWQKGPCPVALGKEGLISELGTEQNAPNYPLVLVTTHHTPQCPPTDGAP